MIYPIWTKGRNQNPIIHSYLPLMLNRPRKRGGGILYSMDIYSKDYLKKSQTEPKDEICWFKVVEGGRSGTAMSVTVKFCGGMSTWYKHIVPGFDNCGMFSSSAFVRFGA
ncbi:MAG TPA: hypothetical protein VE544_06470 [Nitrososphaeraceae archaeon]|nr:hypothetical protein [Nitrososphaeraceae archaeon]